MTTPRPSRSTAAPPLEGEISERADLLTSGEAWEMLRVGSCHLMYFRTAGKLRFRKHGNAFQYKADDVMRLRAATKGTLE